MNLRHVVGRRKLAAAALALSALLSAGSAATIQRPAAAVEFNCGIMQSGQRVWTEWHNGTCSTIGYAWARVVLATSPNGGYSAVFQADGNLVVYNNWAGFAIWAANVYSPNARIIMQNDGNVVIYRYGYSTTDPRSVAWAVDPYFGAYGTMRLIIQDDGNFALFNQNNRLYWSSMTGVIR